MIQHSITSATDRCLTRVCTEDKAGSSSAVRSALGGLRVEEHKLIAFMRAVGLRRKKTS